MNGAGGFIASHLVKRLKSEGFWVRGADLKRPEYSDSAADEFVVGDLRDPEVVAKVVSGVEDVYQLAADMGGAGYIFTGEHDAAVMHNSALINLNTLQLGTEAGVRRFFYSSSACIYPEFNQMDPLNPICYGEQSPTPPGRTANMGGRSYLVSDSTCRICATMTFRCASPASIISSGRMAPGTAEKRKRQRPFAAKWRKRQKAVKSKSGATACKPFLPLC